jgi:hypothetical protein
MPSGSRRIPKSGAGQGVPQPESKPTPPPSERHGPDWLLNLLTVSGPAGEVARFRAAAQGTGGVPWHFDLDHEEARLFAPMAAAGAEARMLVRQIREIQAARHERLLARWAERGGCPLDLHRLIPVPDHILQLGEDDPAAAAWLQAHWGTTRMLRAVRIREEGADRRLRRKAEIVYEFRSADWTPWQAILRLRRAWSKLVFTVQPRYEDG